MFPRCLLPVSLILLFSRSAIAQNPYVHLTKIVVDPIHLAKYKAALQESIEASAGGEPGVLSLYAVYDQELPNHITILETCASKAAYEQHLQTAHLKKYGYFVHDTIAGIDRCGPNRE